MSLSLEINGAPQETDARTVQDLVIAMAEGDRGVAVAINGDVVPRSEWGTHLLREGDRVEVLRAVGGG